MSLPFDSLIDLLSSGLLESLYMTIVSTVIAYIIGIPLGIIVFVTDTGGILKNKPVNFIFGVIINMIRSVPFLILLVAMLPVTRAIVGTTIGSTATIVPLVAAAAPFVAMGASPIQIITRVLLPEAKPSLTVGFTIAISTILGYSAMAGFVGGGGLGAIAINYGYYRYKTDIMLITVALLIIIVQVFQTVGMMIANKIDKRTNN